MCLGLGPGRARAGAAEGRRFVRAVVTTNSLTPVNHGNREGARPNTEPKVTTDSVASSP